MFTAAALAAMTLASAARSDEVTVQNDSVVDFAEAAIVGDFVAGEEAGARLTSPCDGTIVEVQILWLEGVPGHGLSLEEAIRIYDDDDAFPTPGTVLALLEGPVMTPGYLNLFRYLDEAQTMPISVPVTEGQNFYVALEFANPTDVGLPEGGPSVVRDIDTCGAGRNVLYASPGVWLDFCLIITGDLVFRAVIDCPGVTGACCDADANCTDDLFQSSCQGPFETWFEGQACAEVTCPAPIGACCNGTGGCLEDETQADCEDLFGGIYGGNGTTCDVCTLGACCMPDGGCQDVIELVCLDDDGIFQGRGTQCVTTECPQPTGACCIGQNCAAGETEANCTGFGGTWLGAGTDCGPPDPCAVSATIDSAASCRDHGSAPPIERCLNLDANNVEPRLGGVQKLVFELSDPVTTVDASVACTAHTYGGSASATPDGTTVTVEFSLSLPDEDCCTVTLSGQVDDSFDVRTLTGDANRDGSVSTADASSVKGRFGESAAVAGPQYDLNADDSISTADKSSVKQRLENVAPACP